MPAAPVARRTPEISGISGTCAGFSGETPFAIAPPAALFLFGRAGHGKRRELRARIHLLDIRGSAQLVDQIRLVATLEKSHELVTHFVEFGDLAIALLLELDDVP